MSHSKHLIHMEITIQLRLSDRLMSDGRFTKYRAIFRQFFITGERA